MAPAPASTKSEHEPRRRGTTFGTSLTAPMRVGCGYGRHLLYDRMDTGLIEFVRTCIRSVWALELLFFVRSQADQSWSIERLVREQRSSERAVRDALEAFVRAGLVQQVDDAFVYRPATPEIENLVTRLADTYAERPTAVIRMIVAAPEDRLQAFLDAFRLKRD